VSVAVAPVSRMLSNQVRAQLTAYWRSPAFSIFTIALPIIFFVFFGVSHVHDTFPHSHVNVGAYLLGSFGAYAVSNAMVFNFGIGVAGERAQKIDLLQRAMPLPPLVPIAARVVSAMAFALMALLLLFGFAFLAGVRMDALVWLNLAFRLLLGVLPLIGLGMAIGYGSGANAAPAVANLIYLPMSFASGLFVPLQELPDFVQKAAPYLPTYHYGQLAWNAIGSPTESMATAVLWLAGWTVLLFGLAARAYRLEQTRKFS